MDNAKKQKIMIAVLAVCLLGAGGVWYMNSDSSGPVAKSAPTAATKISRKDGAEEPKAVKKHSSREEASPEQEDAATGPVKKTRAKDDSASGPAKTSRDKTPAKKKDKKNLPAV